MDFVFDQTVNGRVIKCSTIVDVASHEAMSIVPERAIGAVSLTRILDRLATDSGLPKAIRTEAGKEFLWQSDAHMSLRARREAASDRTGQAEQERVHQIIERPLPG